MLPYPQADRRVGGLTKALDQLIAAIGVDIDPAAADAEVVGEVGGQELGGVWMMSSGVEPRAMVSSAVSMR